MENGILHFSSLLHCRRFFFKSRIPEHPRASDDNPIRWKTIRAPSLGGRRRGTKLTAEGNQSDGNFSHFFSPSFFFFLLLLLSLSLSLFLSLAEHPEKESLSIK